MSAVFAHGHWRRRDPLEGLTPTMRVTILAITTFGPLRLANGFYRPDASTSFGATPATMTALAIRGLAEQRFSPTVSARPFYRLTRRGREIAAEIGRRAGVRAKLEHRA